MAHRRDRRISPSGSQAPRPRARIPACRRYRWVQSRPVRVSSFTDPPSMRACMREPSYSISCSQPWPVGASSTRRVSWGLIHLGGLSAFATVAVIIRAVAGHPGLGGHPNPIGLRMVKVEIPSSAPPTPHKVRRQWSPHDRSAAPFPGARSRRRRAPTTR